MSCVQPPISLTVHGKTETDTSAITVSPHQCKKFKSMSLPVACIQWSSAWNDEMMIRLCRLASARPFESKELPLLTFRAHSSFTSFSKSRDHSHCRKIHLRFISNLILTSNDYELPKRWLHTSFTHCNHWQGKQQPTSVIMYLCYLTLCKLRSCYCFLLTLMSHWLNMTLLTHHTPPTHPLDPCSRELSNQESVGLHIDWPDLTDHFKQSLSETNDRCPTFICGFEAPSCWDNLEPGRDGAN